MAEKKHGARLSEENLRRMQSVAAFLREIADSVTTGNFNYDLRGRLNDLRIVWNKNDLRKAVVGVNCEGTSTQAFNIELDEESKVDETRS